MTSDEIDKMSDAEYEREYTDDDYALVDESQQHNTITAASEQATEKILSSKQNKAFMKSQDLYNTKIQKHYVSEQVKSDIAYGEQNKYIVLESNGRILLNKINKNGKICLWKYKKSFYFRSGEGNEIYQGNKKDTSEAIVGFLHQPIQIVDLKDISKENLIKHNMIEKYILTYLIPTIEAEIFEPKEDEFFEKNGIMYKNLFKHSKYLKERFLTYRGIK